MCVQLASHPANVPMRKRAKRCMRARKTKKKKRFSGRYQICTCIRMCSDLRRQCRMNIRLIFFFFSISQCWNVDGKKICSSTLGKDIALCENIAEATEMLIVWHTGQHICTSYLYNLCILVSISIEQRLGLNMCKYLQVLFPKFRASRSQTFNAQWREMLTERNAYILKEEKKTHPQNRMPICCGAAVENLSPCRTFPFPTTHPVNAYEMRCTNIIYITKRWAKERGEKTYQIADASILGDPIPSRKILPTNIWIWNCENIINVHIIITAIIIITGDKENIIC